jgi:hypothetical protein
MRGDALNRLDHLPRSKNFRVLIEQHAHFLGARASLS